MRRSRRSRIPRRGGPDERTVRDYRRPGRDGHAAARAARGRAPLAALHAAVRAAGYRVGAARARFGVRGIMCASCVTKIERALRETPGVLGASVSAGTE